MWEVSNIEKLVNFYLFGDLFFDVYFLNQSPLSKNYYLLQYYQSVVNNPIFSNIWFKKLGYSHLDLYTLKDQYLFGLNSFNWFNYKNSYYSINHIRDVIIQNYLELCNLRKTGCRFKNIDGKIDYLYLKKKMQIYNRYLDSPLFLNYLSIKFSHQTLFYKNIYIANYYLQLTNPNIIAPNHMVYNFILNSYLDKKNIFDVDILLKQKKFVSREYLFYYFTNFMDFIYLENHLNSKVTDQLIYPQNLQMQGARKYVNYEVFRESFFYKGPRLYKGLN